MEYNDILEDLTENMMRQKLAFFVASGISRPEPSNLPTGEKLRDALAEAFLGSGDAELQKRMLERIKNGVPPARNPIGLEEVCQAINQATRFVQPDDNDDVIRILKFLLDGPRERPTQPNHIHCFIARCLRDGHVVITTNYDSLVEKAYQQLGFGKLGRLKVFYDENSFARLNFKDKRNVEGCLFKPHGTFSVYRDGRYSDASHSVVTTLERVGKGLPRGIRRAVQYILGDYPTVFMGYSARDIDIAYPILAITRSQKAMFWVKHHTSSDPKVADGVDIDWEKGKEEQVDPIKRDWEQYNVATILQGRRRSGGTSWKVYVDTSQFVKELNSRVFGDTTKGTDSGGSRRPEEEPKETIGKWTVSKTPLHRVLALAQVAERIELYGDEERLCQHALTLCPSAALERRIQTMLGWATRPRAQRDKYEHSVEHYSKALTLSESPDISLVEKAHIHSMLALTHVQHNRLGSARHEIDKALSIVSHMGPLGGLTDLDLSRVADVWNRAANIYDSSVRDPETESTPIGELAIDEIDCLEKALSLGRRSLILREYTGDVRQELQTRNILGLVLTKLGGRQNVEEALQHHQESKNRAGQLGWTREYTQALRNEALAHEKLDLRQAVTTLEDALKTMERVLPADIPVNRWHLGRLLIKQRRYQEAADLLDRCLEDFKADTRWHNRANSLSFLAIALEIIGRSENKARALKLLKEVLDIYENVLNSRRQALAEQPYGCTNGMANLETVKRLVGRLADRTTAARLNMRAEQLIEKVREAYRETQA